MIPGITCAGDSCALLAAFIGADRRPMELPLSGALASAGFPSPADDYMDRKLDLNEHLVDNPEATYFMRVSGDSMLGAGIHHGDILVVDRSVRPGHRSVVVAVVDGGFTVKRLLFREAGPVLVPENPDYEPVPLTEGLEFEVWGVVRHVLHRV